MTQAAWNWSCSDYVQRVGGRRDYNPNRNREVSEIVQDLKLLAKEENLTMLGLCQLGRGVDDRRTKIPELGDLRESGDLESEADIILFPVRETREAREKRNKEGDVSELEPCQILIAKHRNGSTGSVDVLFNGPLVTFDPVADGYAQGVVNATNEPVEADPFSGRFD